MDHGHERRVLTQRAHVANKLEFYRTDLCKHACVCVCVCVCMYLCGHKFFHSVIVTEDRFLVLLRSIEATLTHVFPLEGVNYK